MFCLRTHSRMTDALQQAGKQAVRVHALPPEVARRDRRSGAPEHARLLRTESEIEKPRGDVNPSRLLCFARDSAFLRAIAAELHQAECCESSPHQPQTQGFGNTTVYGSIEAECQ